MTDDRDNIYSSPEWDAIVVAAIGRSLMDRLAAMATLVRVVDTGSFSAAARQLRVGQPAVSKTIAQLEERLGVLLLTRSTRGLSPTDACLAFVERARRALEEADEAELAARGEGAGLEGVLRVSAATSFARLHVIPRLPDFLAAHPGLEVDMILDDRRVDLVEEGVDVSLRLGDLADSSASAQRIGRSPLGVIGTPDYFQRAGEPASPADLAAHDAVIYTQGNTDHWRFVRDGAEDLVAVRGRFRASGAEGVRAAVLAGIGLTIASHWMFGPELDDGSAVTVLSEWRLPPVDLWAVFPGGRLAATKARAFVDFVEKHVLG